MDKNEHKENRSFLETGIAGSYEFSNPTVSRTQLGRMFPRQLKQEKILTPSHYYYQETGIRLPKLDLARPYAWSGQTISDILENEVYLGHTIRKENV